MKSDSKLQTRRKASKSAFKMLHAVTRGSKRRKQRAATTMSPQEMGEVPGVGIARALVVILLIHVAAIAGIYLHNRGNDSNDLKAVAVSDQENPPTPMEGYEVGFLEPGENYTTMAQRYGVDEQELRRLNENKGPKLGWKYNIPKRRIENTSPTQAMAGVVNPPVESMLPDPDASEVSTVIPNERPDIQLSDSQFVTGSVPGPLEQVGSNDSSEGPTLTITEPLLVKPRSPQSTSPIGVSQTHTVKSGETLWGISRKLGVNLQELMKINGMKDGAGLRIGAVLKVPSKQ